jgi:hypothetical protein
MNVVKSKNSKNKEKLTGRQLSLGTGNSRISPSACPERAVLAEKEGAKKSKAGNELPAFSPKIYC